jgi:hypothetical protein
MRTHSSGYSRKAGCHAELESPGRRILPDMAHRLLLWLPSTLSEHDPKVGGPSLIVYDTIAEATSGLTDLPAALVARLGVCNLAQTLAVISNVNARLLHDGMGNEELHRRLEADLVFPELLARLQPVRATRTGQSSVIFTRRSLLLLAKIALGVQRSELGGEFDQREIGTCVLILNELLQPTVAQSDELLIVDMMANWDLFMPADVPHVMARFRLIVRHLLTSTHPTVARAREQLGLGNLLFDGLTFDEFQGLLIGVFGIIANAVGKWEAPVITIEPPLPRFVGGETAVRAFFATRSHALESFSDWRSGGSWTLTRLRELLADPIFLHDLTAFRQRPFVAIEDRYCLPDYHLAFERLTFGSYWTIFDALSGNQRLQFSGAWGLAFEEYVLSLFAASYPASAVLAKIFTPNIRFSSGEIDGVLDFGDHVVALEVKSTLLPVLIRAARDPNAFATWVQDRLVGTEQERGGLRQLAGATAAIRDGLLGGPRGVVYPVLVTDELSFQSLGVNRYLDAIFRGLAPSDRGIRPLTVITTDELEKLLPCITDGLVTWCGVLDRRAADRDGWMWVGQALIDELVALGRTDQVRRHDVLVQEYHVFLRGLKGRPPDLDPS